MTAIARLVSGLFASTCFASVAVRSNSNKKGVSAKNAETPFWLPIKGAAIPRADIQVKAAAS
jgi:hypothetical protein